jgi:SLA1 homology domain 1, SHD1
LSRLAIIALLFVATPASARVWTDFTGIHRTEAEIISVRDDAVLLRKTDGSQVRIPFDKLSHDDMAYLKDYIHKHPNPGGPPEALKSEPEKAADAVNAVLKKLKTQIDATQEETTEVRQRLAYANVLKTLDSEIKSTTFELYFPIENVASDDLHTLSLGKPELIEGYEVWLNQFRPKLPENKAIEINRGDALVLKGHGRLEYNYSSAQLMKGDKLRLQCVLVTYNETSKQHYGLMLVDYKFRIEKRITVEIPKPVESPKPNPIVVTPVFGQPNTPVVGTFPPIQPPAQNVSAFPLTQPPVQTQFAATPPVVVVPAPQTENVAPTPPVVVSPLSRIDLNVSYAKYVKSKLTPDKYDQRDARLRSHFPGYAQQMSLPQIDIGHNYHPVFWRAIQSWPADRIALWAYHNRDNIGYEYWKQIANRSGVDSELTRLVHSGARVDPGYIDPEFINDPDLMYNDSFVSAIYNSPSFDYAEDWTMPWTTLVAVCVFGMILLLAWTKYEGWF